MIPLGYMLKAVAPRPDYVKAAHVVDVYSVSRCVSEDFDDYFPLGLQNGYDLFDTPKMVDDAAATLGADTRGLRLFYYEAHAEEFDNGTGKWTAFGPTRPFETGEIRPPANCVLAGYDVVSFETGRDHSPLSCQSLADVVPVNAHCLTETLEDALNVARSGLLADCKPGPYRFVAVYVVT